MNELLTAIYSHYQASALPADLTGDLHLAKAPQSVTAPYGVYSLVSATPEYVMGGSKEHVLLQFNIFADGGSALTCGDLAATLRNSFDDCQLTIPGYRLVRCLWEMSQLLKHDDTWQAVVQYRLLVEKL